MAKKEGRQGTSGASSDPQGKRIQVYRPSVAAILGLAISVLLGGIGVLV